jgi:hypothetical protein
MKLSRIRTVVVYRADDGGQYKHTVYDASAKGSIMALWSWQQLRPDKNGNEYWSGSIRDEVIEQLDEAVRLESFERNP